MILTTVFNVNVIILKSVYKQKLSDTVSTKNVVSLSQTHIARALNNTQSVTLFSTCPYSNATLTIARLHPGHESLTICWLGGTRGRRGEEREREREHRTKSAFLWLL